MPHNYIDESAQSNQEDKQFISLNSIQLYPSYYQFYNHLVKAFMRKYKSIPHEFFKKPKPKISQSSSDNDSLIEQVRQLGNYVGHSNRQYSSIKAVDREYFPHQQYHQRRKHKHEQMVLVPKRKLESLYEEIKVLKRAIKSQNKLFKSQIGNLKKNTEKANRQRILLMKQSQYLKDMERSASENNFRSITFRRSGFNYHS